jgi:kynureninase
MSPQLTRQDCVALDERDPLAPFRSRFDLPAGVIYLDGNSLGALPHRVRAAVTHTVDHEWGQQLVTSWNGAGWFASGSRVGALIAPLIGAAPHQVVAGDSTSINIFKAVTAALRLRPGRNVIVSERGNFPTDSYIIHGAARAMQAEVIDVDPADVSAAIAAAGDRLALVELTHVHYKTGAMYDMAAITDLTHRNGGLVLWDLAHSAGALPVHLDVCRADFAVGCGYKYLNGGPGAPAFVYVAERHHGELDPVLTGWFAHRDPFAFEHGFEPIDGIERMLVGTPNVLSMVALEAALLDWADVDLQALRAKSCAMGDLFIRLTDERLHTYGFGLASPRDATLRGSQVSLTHEHGYAIMQALISKGVIGDFRAPEILRFGFTPLYVGYADLWDAVEILREIMESKSWDSPEFTHRKTVT